jgi:hypothetical protein
MLTLFKGMNECRIVFLNINFAAIVLGKLTFCVCACVYTQIETQT